MTDWDVKGQQLLEQGSKAWSRGDRAEAEALFNQLLDEYPDRPEGYNKVGVVLAETGQLEQAEQYFLTALSKDRMHAPSLTNLGNIFLERGDVDQAIQHYLLALQSDPEYPPAHRNLGVAYRRQRKYSAFVSHYKRAQRFEDRRERDAFRHRRGQAVRSPDGKRSTRPPLPSFVWWVLAGVGMIIILTAVHL